MKTLRELKLLVTDPMRYYLELCHLIKPCFLDDPLEQNSLTASWDIKESAKKLYFEDLGKVFKKIPFLSMMDRELNLKKLQTFEQKIQDQLKFLCLNKEDIFSLHVVDHIRNVAKRGSSLFIPKNKITGTLSVASEAGILAIENREKSFSKFLEHLTNLLFLSTIESNVPLKILFLDQKTFSLSHEQATHLFDAFVSIEPLVKKGATYTTIANNKDRYEAFAPLLNSLETKECLKMQQLEHLLKETYDKF